ncbi:MAG: hypothetical protein ACRDKI_06150 [Solirubrobacterales bacterium]
MARTLHITLLTALCVIAWAQPASAAIDKTFGKSGVALSKQASRDMVGNQVAVGADGRIVVSELYEYEGSDGHAKSTVTLAEFDEHGKPRRSFGHGGLAQYIPNSGAFEHRIMLDPQGRVLILLWDTGKYYAGVGDLVIVRLRANGRIDRAFNGGNKLRLERQNDFSDEAMRIAADGSVYVYNGGVNVTPRVIKLSPQGKFVTSYGKQGKAYVPLADYQSDTWRFSALLPDGSTILAGQTAPGADPLDFGPSPTAAAFMKLDPSGKPDPTFGTNGGLELPGAKPPAFAYDAAADSGGTITALVYGVGTTHSAWARRIGPTGGALPFGPFAADPNGVSIPSPAIKHTYDHDYRLAGDGSYSILFYNWEGGYEVMTVAADGAAVKRGKPTQLSRSLMQRAGSPIFDQRDGTVVIPVGVKHRLGVVRLLPSS